MTFFLPLITLAQRKAAPAQPAPQITGTFLDTDGARRLTLGFRRNSKSETFTGIVQSVCMVPAPSEAGEGKPLNLSAIPIGTPMTVFYVRHAQMGKPGKPPENVIMALRFDRVPRRGLGVAPGVAIPCFKGAEHAR